MADEYYNNKIVTTDGDVLMDLTQDTATPEAVLEGETFHLRSGAPATGTYRPSDEIEARLKATVGHSSKNLLDIDGFDDTQYNVHGYSENGYFRLVGTYRSDGAHQFFRIYFKLPAGSYILSGAPDYSTTLIRIAMCTYTSNPANYNTIGYDFGENLSFTLNEDSNCFIAFRFQSGVIGVPIDLTLPIMIRSGSISDGTFKPYVTPTDERIIALEQRVAALEAIINNR